MMKKAVILGSIAFGLVVFAGGTGCRRQGLAGTSSAPGITVTAQTLGLSKLSASYAEAKASAKKEGLPITPANLAQPAVPNSENAAPVYRQLTKLLTAKPISSDNIVARVTGKRMPDAAQIAQIRTELKARTDVLALVHKAAARPKCNFDRDYSLGPKLMFPEYAKMRAAIRTLSAESAVLLADGKPFDAIKNQTLGFNIARHAATDSFVIAHLVAIGLDAITLHGIEKILYAEGDRPGVAAAVEKSIAANWHPHKYRQALGGEAVMFCVVLKGLHEKGMSYDADIASAYKKAQQKFSDTPEWEPFIDANGAFLIDVVRGAVKAGDRPYPEALPFLQKLITAIQNDTTSTHLLANILIPVYSQALAKYASDEAKVNVVRCAASVLSWRQVHGSLPKSLAEAMLKVPRDPYDGKPLRYRLVGSGFVVYSVGPTGKFDGGTPDKKPNAQEGYFEYPIARYETALSKFTTPTK